jgi:hypothetical protein
MIELRGESPNAQADLPLNSVGNGERGISSIGTPAEEREKAHAREREIEQTAAYRRYRALIQQFPTQGVIPMTDTAIESEIQAKGLTAPRVTPADIEANILSEHYFTASDAVQTTNAVNRLGITRGIPSFALDLLTICVLVLNNGFTVTGESACASPKNFDAELGRKIARGNAVAKIWPLMGYALKQSLSEKARQA